METEPREREWTQPRAHTISNVDAFGGQQLPQPGHLLLQLPDEASVRILVHHSLAHDLLRTICVSVNTRPTQSTLTMEPVLAFPSRCLSFYQCPCLLGHQRLVKVPMFMSACSPETCQSTNAHVCLFTRDLSKYQCPCLLVHQRLVKVPMLSLIHI